MNIARYKWFLITGTVLLIVIIFYLVRSVSAVSHAVRSFDDAYFASLEQKESDTINQCSIPGYIDLLRKKSYLGAQVKMADSDSIGLVVNVRDSLIHLMIKGVSVRTVRISEYDLSPFFQRANQEAVYNMLSAPLVITSMQATFMKDPVSVKIAPKDTSEAVIDVKPDTTDYEAVFFTLETDRNIRFFFEQQEDTIAADKRARFFFDLEERYRNARSTIHSVVKFNTPHYTPYIKIWIPKAEAKIVYRAIPREGLIVVTK